MLSSSEPGGWKEERKEGRAVFPRAFPDETLSRAMRAKKKMDMTNVTLNTKEQVCLPLTCMGGLGNFFSLLPQS